MSDDLRTLIRDQNHMLLLGTPGTILDTGGE
jgi:hypothetical protein